MSAIAGLWFLDGRPVAPKLFDGLIGRLRDLGPDRCGTWVGSSVALGALALHTTKEAEKEYQPIADASERYRLVWDGRVDNRDELRGKILGLGGRLRDDTDAELVLGAWLAWGENAPWHILGDFAFAIWDSVERRMYCARDPFGWRTFYYVRTAKLFAFATELAPLLELPEVSQEVNESVVAEYLAERFTSAEETLYRDILRLQPASWMAVSATGVRGDRYWAFDMDRRLRYKTDAEYAEHFLTLFEDAIRVRLRSNSRVASHLSGGMDSSSVSVIGHQLAGDIETLSMVYPGWNCDESAYISEIAGKAGLRNLQFPHEPPPPGFYAAESKRSRDFPGYPNHRAQDLPLTRFARQSGVRVILSGSGGNQCFEGTYLFLAAMLQEGLYSDAIGSAKRLAARWEVPWPGVLAQWGLRPLVPRMLRPSWWGWDRMTFPWLRREYLNRTGLRERIHAQRKSDVALARYGADRAAQAVQFHYPSQMLHRETTCRSDRWNGVETRHPFYDRRLVEFSLEIPYHQRRTDGLTKMVMRNAMAGRLPKAVLERRYQAEFSALFLEATKTIGWNMVLESAYLNDRLAHDTARAFVQSMKAACESEEARFKQRLWGWIGIGLWSENGLGN